MNLVRVAFAKERLTSSVGRKPVSIKCSFTIPYYPEHSDRRSILCAMQPIAVRRICVVAETNSLIIKHLPQMMRVTVVIHWFVKQSMFAKGGILANGRNGTASLEGHWLTHCSGTK